MKSRYLIALALIASVPFLYGFTAGYLKTVDAVTESNDNLSVTGEQLFQKNCSACHGIERQGNPPTFPSLVSVGDRMSRTQVAELLLSGRKVMPSFAHLSSPEREAITGYLFGETLEVEMITELTPAENGHSLFVANCSRCHKATPDDPQPPDQKDWGMQPAVLGGITAKHDIDNFESIVNAGPCYMPSFDFLERQDKLDIYTWLQTMEGEVVAENSRYGKGCRMKCNNR